MNTWISTKYHYNLMGRSKIIVRFILQHFSSLYPIPLQALELHKLSWLGSFSKAFIKIYYLLKFRCHIVVLQKWRAVAIQFLAIFNKFSLQHLLNHKHYFLTIVWRYRNYFQLPKNPVLKFMHCFLFLTIKDWGISKRDQTIVKGMVDAG